MRMTLGTVDQGSSLFDEQGTVDEVQAKRLAKVREIRVANARRQNKWKEIPLDEVTVHDRYFADRDGNLYERMTAPVFAGGTHATMNEITVCAFFVDGDGDVVPLQHSSFAKNVAELERKQAERAARLEAQREKQRAGIRSLTRAPLSLADLLGVETLPTLRAAVLQLDGFDCIGVDRGQIALRLPVRHEKREELAVAARVAWHGRDVIAAHVAGKRPLAALPDAQLLADGSVAK